LKSFLLAIVVLLLCFNCVRAQAVIDSLQKPLLVDAIKQASVVNNLPKQLIDTNIFLNTHAAPQALQVEPSKHRSKQAFFYLIVALFLLLGITRTLYNRYFTTLFRVFFNTTLKQNQLTDQLEQAKLPSLIFNLFFIITSGIYFYLLIKFLGTRNTLFGLKFMLACIAFVGICYSIKFISLKFIGWLTGYKEAANTYIFIIFLLNKMIGILLLPIITLMAFSSVRVVSAAVLVSLIILTIILLVRFFRSFSLLQHRLKVSKFHFLLYVLALEILPLLLIYKLGTHYLVTNA
jgi:hypothetical protein